MNTFNVDYYLSDDEVMYVDILGRGTVMIQVTDDRIAVDILSLNASTEPAATCKATWDEIQATEEQ